MKVISVSIKERASYEEFPGKMVGTILLMGAMGKQEIVLSSEALSRVFKVISDEVCATAKINAEQVRGGMREAVHGPLLEQATTISIKGEL